MDTKQRDNEFHWKVKGREAAVCGSTYGRRTVTKKKVQCRSCLAIGELFQRVLR